MRKLCSTLVVGILLVCLSSVAHGQHVDLQTPVQLTKGDIVALMLTDVINVWSANFQAKVVAAYAPKDSVISIDVIGQIPQNLSKTDYARERLEAIWALTQQLNEWFLELHGIELTAEDVVMNFYNGHTSLLILTFKDGSFVLP